MQERSNELALPNFDLERPIQFVDFFRERLDEFSRNWSEVWKGSEFLNSLYSYDAALSAPTAPRTQLLGFIAYEDLRRHYFRDGALPFPPGFNSGPMHNSRDGIPILGPLPREPSDLSGATLGLLSTAEEYQYHLRLLLAATAGALSLTYTAGKTISEYVLRPDNKYYHIPYLGAPVEEAKNVDELQKALLDFYKRSPSGEFPEITLTVSSPSGRIESIKGEEARFLLSNASMDLALQQIPVIATCFSDPDSVQITVDLAAGKLLGLKCEGIATLPEGEI